MNQSKIFVDLFNMYAHLDSLLSRHIPSIFMSSDILL